MKRFLNMSILYNSLTRYFPSLKYGKKLRHNSKETNWLHCFIFTGLNSEGLYRVSGFSDLIEDVKMAFDRGMLFSMFANLGQCYSVKKARFLMLFLALFFQIIPNIKTPLTIYDFFFY